MEASVTNVIQTVEAGSAGKALGSKQATGQPRGTRGNPAIRQSGNQETGLPRNPEPRIAKLPDGQIAKSLGSRF
jgi:hypothetical protein